MPPRPTVAIVIAATLGLAACTAPGRVERSTAEPVRVQGNAAARARQHFLEGSLLEMRERHRDAIAEYRRAIRLDSTMGAAYYALGKAFRAVRQTDSAIHYSELALRRNPGELRAREQLADLLVVAGDIEHAVEQYERILETRPNDIAARYMAARLLQHLDPGRAIAHFEYMLRNLTDDMDVMVRLADLYMETGDVNGATRVIRSMLNADPSNPDLHATVVEMLLDADRYEEAAAAVRDAEDALDDADDLESFLVDELRSANQRLGRSGATDSLRLYARSLVARTGADGSWRVRFHAGLVSLSLGDSVQAESLIARAIGDPDSDEDAWLTIATRLLNRNGASLGVRSLGSAVTRHRTSGRVPYLFGIMHELAGRDDSASYWLRWGIDNVEELPEAWEALGRLRSRAGDTVGSDAAYSRAIELDPHNAIALNNLAYALAQRGSQLEHALDLATRASATSPNNAAFLDTRGWILLQLGRVDEAVVELRRAVDLDGSNAEILRHLARAEAIVGHHDAAAAALSRASALDGR